MTVPLSKEWELLEIRRRKLVENAEDLYWVVKKISKLKPVLGDDSLLDMIAEAQRIVNKIKS